MRGMSVDHASAVAAPKSDPVFLHVKAGITVIVTDTEVRRKIRVKLRLDNHLKQCIKDSDY